MDYAALKVEIANDPTGRGYAGKTDAQIADLLNAPKTETVSRGILPAKQFYGDLAARQLTYKVTACPDTTADVNVGGTMVSIAEVKHAVEDLKFSQVANTQDAIVQGMVGAAVAFGIATQEQASELLYTSVSRAEKLLGVGVMVSADDVHNARVGDW